MPGMTGAPRSDMMELLCDKDGRIGGEEVGIIIPLISDGILTLLPYLRDGIGVVVTAVVPSKEEAGAAVSREEKLSLLFIFFDMIIRSSVVIAVVIV